MKAPKTINATEARNDFFNLLRESFLEKQPFIIEKGKIPMVFVVPVSESNWGEKITFRQKKVMQLLKSLGEFRGKMRETSDSVKLLREMRMYGQ